MISFEEDLLNACKVLKEGGVIIYPTDTVWGIGCDANCSDAVNRIFALKHRADNKSMISLVADADMLERYVGISDCELYKSIKDRFNKPVSMVFPKVVGVCRELVAANGSCALRVTGERFSQEVCRGINGAVVSTSANLSGKPTARFFNEIDPAILSGVDYVVYYGREDDSVRESSAVVIVDAISKDITVLRS